MTDAEKLAMLKSLLHIDNTSQDAYLNTCLSFAKNELIAWRYGSANSTPLARAVDSEENTVYVYVATFIAALAPTSGASYVFAYSGDNESWQYDSEDVELIDYGISVTGAAIDTETITVTYSENTLAEYDTIIIMACVAGYGLSGLENQTSSTENGITRQFKYSDMAMYIMSNVTPYVAVI